MIYEGRGSNLPNTPYVFTHDKAPDMTKSELGKFHKISGDPDIDKWAEAARIELDPAKCKALMLNIWNRDMEKVYRIPATGGLAFEIMQPWMRGIRFGGALGTSAYYYNWGSQIANRLARQVVEALPVHSPRTA